MNLYIFLLLRGGVRYSNNLTGYLETYLRVIYRIVVQSIRFEINNDANAYKEITYCYKNI